MEGNWKFLQRLFVFACIAYIAHCAVLDLTRDKYMSEECRKAKPIHSNYTPRGSEYTIGNLTVYESDNRSAKRLLIAVYDILGFSTNIMEVVDTIAERHNFRVVLPHFFRENWWNDDNWPPESSQELIDWMERNVSWDGVVKYDIYNVMNTFSARDNISEVGIFGMCYGGLVSTLAATHIDEIKAAGLVHPSLVNNSDADGVRRPMYLLPASNDIDMLPWYEVLKEKFGDNSGHRRFTDMRHGFAGARGNFSDPLNRQRLDEVIDILGTFFDRNLRNT